jgi:hypothetical protein
VSALLDALGSDFTPTHWGENERCRLAFDREKMIATIGAYPPDHYIPGVARRRPFAYAGWFVTDAGTMQKVYLEFGPPPDPAALQTVFDLGERLARHLTPLFGTVHPVWLGKGQDYNAASVLCDKELRQFGPGSLCARTWFGPHLIDLIGRERLAGAVHSLVELPGGCVQADLLSDPWAHDIGTLEPARVRGMAALAEAEVFGDYSVFRKYKAGVRWVCPQPEPTN